MSFVLLGILNSQAAGAGGLPFFIETHANSAYSQMDRAVARNSPKYAFFSRHNGGSDPVYSVVDGEGALTNSFGFAGHTHQFYLNGDISEDSMVTAIRTGTTGTTVVIRSSGPYDGTNAEYATKFNAPAANTSGNVLDVATHAGGDVVVGRDSPGSGGDIGYALFFNSSGTLITAQKFNFQNANDYFFEVKSPVNQAPLAYAAGWIQNSGFSPFPYMAKFTTTGSFASHVYFSNISSRFYGYDVLSSNNNFEVVWTCGTFNNTDVGKMSNGFTSPITFGRYTNNSLGFQHLGIDDEDNIYLARINTGNNTPELSVTKFNSAGTIQWARRITPTAGVSRFDQFPVINYDGFDGIVIAVPCNTPNGNNANMLLRLPKDGDILGTYSNGTETYEITVDSDSFTSSVTMTAATPSVSYTQPSVGTSTQAAGAVSGPITWTENLTLIE